MFFFVYKSLFQTCSSNINREDLHGSGSGNRLV